MSKKKIVFVVGMHRCGTSLLSSYLASLGYDLGKSEDKTKDVVNPLGYFENSRLTELHDQMLAHNGVSWDTASTADLSYTRQHIEDYSKIINQDFRGNKIVIKDPRLSFFTGFINDLVLKNKLDVKIIFCTRNKKEVVQSLMKAQHRGVDMCEKLYEDTHKCFSDEMLKISYNDHIVNQENTQRKICEFLGDRYETTQLVNETLYRSRHV